MSRAAETATDSASRSAWELPALLGQSPEIDRLRLLLDRWVTRSDEEVRLMIARQMSGRAKHFRPVTLFACHRAVSTRPPTVRTMRAAAAVEIVHNVSLIVDDILDRSRFRRGMLSLHCRYGFLPALMTAGYMSHSATALVADDAYAVRLVSELMQRLGSAECLQWRVRRQPMGVEDWRSVAGADTGSMFEICARLGTRDDRLARYGLLLGTLYHGCDDVADVRGTVALGGGSEKDIIDGILTLPAAIAIRDPETAVLFRAAGPATADAIAERLHASLSEAEAYLDRLAAEAESEARRNAPRWSGLVDLIAHTRALSVA